LCKLTRAREPKDNSLPFQGGVINRSSTLRKAANLPESVRQQLNGYALAATAAGVGALALAQPANAKIVYTPAHVKIAGHVNLDLNHDGITDFVFINTVRGHFAWVNVLSLQQNRVWGRRRNLGRIYASALPAGIRVGRNQAEFQKGPSCYISASHYGPCKFMTGCTLTTQASTLGCSGTWGKKARGYVGLKFNVNGKTHYGWARLTVVHKLTVVVTLTGYAYETIPNMPIITGKTKGPDDESIEQPNSAALTVPSRKPASLGLLAIGSPGLSIWRREESVGGVTCGC
jgi:hypothetical protein